MRFQIVIPEQVKSEYIATDNDYVRNVIIAYLEAFFTQHPNAKIKTASRKEEVRKLTVVGSYAQDIREYPQITINSQIKSTKKLSINDVAYGDADKIVYAWEQRYKIDLNIQSLSWEECSYIENLLAYGFMDRWTMHYLYYYGIQIIPNSVSATDIRTINLVPDTLLYRASVSLEAMSIVFKEVKKPGIKIDRFVVEADGDP